MAAKAWGGRFAGSTDPRVEQFTESISFDARLAEVDICGSQAHARMLADVGLISADECEQLVTHLDQIGEEIAAGNFVFRTDLEDIHMHIEHALIERLGCRPQVTHSAQPQRPSVHRSETLRQASDHQSSKSIT